LSKSKLGVMMTKNLSGERDGQSRKFYPFSTPQHSSSLTCGDRKYFNGRGKRLVFVPHSDAADGEGEPRGIWYGLHQCLWDGPKCLRLHVCLKELYPGIRRLFTDILGITDASMRVLMLEASCFKMRDDLGYIRDILLELDKFLEKDRTYTSQVGPLKSKKIWPVVQSEVHGEFGHLMTATEDEWFIPDREPLKECFSNIVPLFALQPNDIDKMERLLKGLELDGRLLSRAAMSVPRTSGTVSYHAGHTEDFRSRYEFMARSVVPRYLRFFLLLIKFIL